jgi:hypothetical protein
VMIPCLCTLYFNSNRMFCAQTLRSSPILFRAPFWLYHNIFIQFIFWIIWLLSSFVESFFTMLSYFACNLFPLSICLWICVCVFALIFGYPLTLYNKGKKITEISIILGEIWNGWS